MSDIEEIISFLCTATKEEILAFEQNNPVFFAYIRKELNLETADEQRKRSDAMEELTHILHDRQLLLTRKVGGELITNTLGVAAHCLEHRLEMPAGVQEHLLSYFKGKFKQNDQPLENPREALTDAETEYLNAKPAKKSGKPPNHLLIKIAVIALLHKLPIPVYLYTPLIELILQLLRAENRDVKVTKSTSLKNRTEEADWRNQLLARLVAEIQHDPPNQEVCDNRRKLDGDDAAAVLLRRLDDEIEHIGSEEYKAELRTSLSTDPRELSPKQIEEIVNRRCRMDKSRKKAFLKSLGLLGSDGKVKENAESLTRRIRLFKEKRKDRQ